MFSVTTREPPAVARATLRLEESQAMDGAVAALKPVADALLSSPKRRDVLQGMWLGHGIHPLLTDLPLGFWTSANVLDLIGGEQARPAARRLIGLGVLAALPTALTGLAEWGSTQQRERRVGLVHAVANSAALTMYAGSWRARRHHAQPRAVVLGLAGSGLAALGGYLGGHLTEARKVSSRHPVFEPGGSAAGG